jgi:hypothetical protein
MRVIETEYPIEIRIQCALCIKISLYDCDRRTMQSPPRDDIVTVQRRSISVIAWKEWKERVKGVNEYE